MLGLFLLFNFVVVLSLFQAIDRLLRCFGRLGSCTWEWLLLCNLGSLLHSIMVERHRLDQMISHMTHLLKMRTAWLSHIRKAWSLAPIWSWALLIVSKLLRNLIIKLLLAILIIWRLDRMYSDTIDRSSLSCILCYCSPICFVFYFNLLVHLQILLLISLPRYLFIYQALSKIVLLTIWNFFV